MADAAPLFPPGTPTRVAVLLYIGGARGTAARLRALGWRSGAAGVKKLPGILKHI